MLPLGNFFLVMNSTDLNFHGFLSGRVVYVTCYNKAHQKVNNAVNRSMAGVAMAAKGNEWLQAFIAAGLLVHNTCVNILPIPPPP